MFLKYFRFFLVFFGRRGVEGECFYFGGGSGELSGTPARRRAAAAGRIPGFVNRGTWLCDESVFGDGNLRDPESSGDL